jgi:hypothetical protein
MPDYQDPAALRASLAAHATAVLARAGLEPADVDYVAYAENHMCCDRRVVAASDATVAYDVFAGPGSAFGAVWRRAAPKSTAGSRPNFRALELRHIAVVLADFSTSRFLSTYGRRA